MAAILVKTKALEILGQRDAGWGRKGTCTPEPWEGYHTAGLRDRWDLEPATEELSIIDQGNCLRCMVSELP